MSFEASEADWFKSSYSSGQTECVEVAWLEGDLVGVRDSKNPTGAALAFAPEAWGCFTADIRSRELLRRAAREYEA